MITRDSRMDWIVECLNSRGSIQRCAGYGFEHDDENPLIDFLAAKISAYEESNQRFAALPL